MIIIGIIMNVTMQAVSPLKQYFLEEMVKKVYDHPYLLSGIAAIFFPWQLKDKELGRSFANIRKMSVLMTAGLMGFAVKVTAHVGLEKMHGEHNHQGLLFSYLFLRKPECATDGKDEAAEALRRQWLNDNLKIYAQEIWEQKGK